MAKAECPWGISNCPIINTQECNNCYPFESDYAIEAALEKYKARKIEVKAAVDQPKNPIVITILKDAS